MFLGDRCGVNRLCYRCRWHRATRMERTLLSLSRRIDEEREHGFKKAVGLLVQLENEFSEIKRLISAGKIRTTREKTAIKAKVQKAFRLGRNAGLVVSNQDKKRFWMALKHTRRPGPMLRLMIDKPLADARKRMKERAAMEWQVITLTVPSKGNTKDAYQTASSGFSKLWKRFLSAPGAGAIKFVEVSPEETNAHVHVVYYGFKVKYKDLRFQWEELTSLGNVCPESFRYGRVESVKRLTRYFHKMDKLPPEVQVRFWRLAKGVRLVEKYGVIRKLWSEEDKRVVSDRKLVRMGVPAPTGNGDGVAVVRFPPLGEKRRGAQSEAGTCR